MVELGVWDRVYEELLEGTSQLAENNLDLVLVTDFINLIHPTLVHTVIKGMMLHWLLHMRTVTRMKMSVLVAYRYNMVYDICTGGIDSWR